MAGSLPHPALLVLTLVSLLLAGCTSDPSNVPPAAPGDITITVEPENQTVADWSEASLLVHYHNEAGSDRSMCGPSLHQLRIDVEGEDDTRWTGVPRAGDDGPCPTQSIIAPGIARSIAVPFHRFQFSDGSLPEPNESGNYLVVVGHPHYAAETEPVTVRLADS